MGNCKCKVYITAERIIGVPSPNVDSIFRTRLLKKANDIIEDHSHPANYLFKKMKSGVRYRSLSGNSKRSQTSTYASAVRQLNISLAAQ